MARRGGLIACLGVAVMALAACGGDTAQQASGPQSHANKALLPTKWSAAPIDTQGTVVAVLSCPTTQFCMGIDKVHGRAVAWQGGCRRPPRLQWR